MSLRKAIFLFGLLLAAAGASRAEVYQFAVPSDDRWHYPFNFNPGGRPTASCFGSTADPNYDTFNDRDGIFLIGWRTDAAVPIGLPLASYGLEAVRVTLTHLGSVAGTSPSWNIDLTSDEWFWMDYPISDMDPGQPLELFGVGFGPSFTYTGWNEGSLYVGGDQFDLTPRDPYPFLFQGNTSTKLHVEDNVKDAFTPQPWAIGVPVGYVPARQSLPFPVTFDIDLALSGGKVKDYFREQLAGGRVLTAITSLQVTFKQADSGYPTFFTKEGAPLAQGGKAPMIELTLTPTGDINGNSVRDLVDMSSLKNCLDGPDLQPLPPAPLTTAKCTFLFDFDEDGDVDLEDYSAFARKFP